jgi:hypothetical protein
MTCDKVSKGFVLQPLFHYVIRRRHRRSKGFREDDTNPAGCGFRHPHQDQLPTIE